MYTYDQDLKKWIAVYTDNLGNYDVASTSGWVGNKSVWHDKIFAPTAEISSISDEYDTKVSDKKFTWTQSFVAHGKKVTVNGACTKTT